MFATLPVSSFVLASLGAFTVARYAEGLSLLDSPNERSSHCRPTPKGGGVGILAAFSMVTIATGVPLWFWIPVSALSLIAGYGDRVELTARSRLFAQLGLVALFVLGTWQSPHSYYLCYPFIVFWIVFIAGTANFYNFMDGINGIAGIAGAVGFSLLAFYVYSQEGQTRLVNLSICMAFSCLGFLPFNMPKAKVFMGDIGSILLGVVFAGLVYLASHTILDFLCMASFLFPFYTDELCTMAVRLREGEKLTQPHRRHVYQLLANEREMPHWQVSVGYGLVQLIVGMTVLSARAYGYVTVIGLLAFYFTAFALGSWHLRSSIGGQPSELTSDRVPSYSRESVIGRPEN